MRLSVSIMAHPDRRGHVVQLLARLGDLSIPVAWDDEGPPSGNHDRVWRNARRAWEMHDPESDWHVLIQDDALVCGDFLAGLEQALKWVPPGVVVSPYFGTSRNTSVRWRRLAAVADEHRAVWLRTDRIMWGVCLVVPTRLIGEMIECGDRKAGIPDDMRVSGWARRQEMEVWYTWPSLVDHRPVPSLTKHRAADRVAMRHHSESATAIDWSGPAVTDSALARRRPLRSGPRRARDRSTVRGATK